MVSEQLCTVCGYEMEEGPRDYNICPSCGTEFGIHDINSSIVNLRSAWLSTGPQWHSTVVREPQGWEPIRQLTRIFLNPNPVIQAPPFSNDLVPRQAGLAA